MGSKFASNPADRLSKSMHDGRGQDPYSIVHYFVLSQTSGRWSVKGEGGNSHPRAGSSPASGIMVRVKQSVQRLPAEDWQALVLELDPGN